MLRKLVFVGLLLVIAVVCLKGCSDSSSYPVGTVSVSGANS